jgi:hypothetical protein
MKIERNFRKNPHTANFLMSFHTGGQGLPADLLETVPVEAPAFRPSAAQTTLMDKLVAEITGYDAETGAKARAYIDGMTVNGRWTPGREGNLSAWIGRMIAKANELRKTTPVALPTVADGRYAVEEAGTLKFFRVKNGRKVGFVFLDVQASDDWHPIRTVTRINRVLATIAVDPHAAMIRYGHELGECGRCGRTLTDEASRAAGIGPICQGK